MDVGAQLGEHVVALDVKRPARALPKPDKALDDFERARKLVLLGAQTLQQKRVGQRLVGDVAHRPDVQALGLQRLLQLRKQPLLLGLADACRGWDLISN